MSTSKNAKRVNLSFKCSSKDQSEAFEILNNVENKTEYITRLVLREAKTNDTAKRIYTQEDITEMLNKTLPAILEKYLAANPNIEKSPLETEKEVEIKEKPFLDQDTQDLLFGALAGFGNM